MKTSWSKILFIASDLVIAAYLVLAITAFDKKGDSKAVCSKVNIEIADNATEGFLDAKVIKERLQKTGNYPIGRQLNEINTRGIEETLRQSPFVKTAECYKTEGGHVYISVTQRMPVIRIKADNGDDYYVDDNDCIMPRTNYTSDLIIASGNISRSYAINYMSAVGKIIMQNDLWKNLIEQIHILPDHGVELVPRIGDHIVYVGKLPDGKDRQQHEAAIADFLAKKMARLEKFYKYGLSQVGWNKYSYVNIEFDNQIICKRSGAHTAQLAASAPPTPIPATEEVSASAADGPSEGEATIDITATNADKAAAKTDKAAANSEKATVKKDRNETNGKSDKNSTEKKGNDRNTNKAGKKKEADTNTSAKKKPIN